MDSNLTVVYWEKKTYSIFGFTKHFNHIGVLDCCGDQLMLKGDLSNVDDRDIQEHIVGRFYPDDFKLNAFFWVILCWSPGMSIVLTLVMALYWRYVNRIVKYGLAYMALLVVMVNAIWYYYLTHS